ncbi:MAG TPA: spore coat protein U domain-containing protein [Gammaproteobacteria bacterium]|nr:spore coat protein U domain-containing protein [Gammaproteobacteria bacterium]
MRSIMAMLLLLAGLLAAPGVMAQTCTATAPTVHFGTVPTPVPQSDVTTPITINCSGGSSNGSLRICVGITPAMSPSGERRMFGPGVGSLAYDIYKNSGRTQRWADNSATARELVQVSLNASGSGSTTMNMYARMSAGGSPANGAYHSGTTDDTISGSFHNGNSCNSSTAPGTFNGSPFDVSVLVGGNCTITAAPLLDFGSVMGSTTTQIDSAVTLHATCNNQLPYTIALNAGQVVGNTIADRRLGLDGTGPGVLRYQLYRDAGRSQLWGDGTAGSVHVGTGNGVQQDIIVYGRVPAGQAMPAAGTYRDTVTATITY